MIQNIVRLNVSSAKTFVIYDVTHLEHLIEGVNEGWLDNISIKDSWSQSNYFVEFRRFVFIDEQFKKLDSRIETFSRIFYLLRFIEYTFLSSSVRLSAVLRFSILSIVKTCTAWSLSSKLLSYFLGRWSVRKSWIEKFLFFHFARS